MGAPPDRPLRNLSTPVLSGVQNRREAWWTPETERFPRRRSTRKSVAPSGNIVERPAAAASPWAPQGPHLLLSFARPKSSPLQHLVDGPAEAIEVGEWAESKDADVSRRFLRLLNHPVGRSFKRTCSTCVTVDDEDSRPEPVEGRASCQEVGADMVERRAGTSINVGSHAQGVVPVWAGYLAATAALNAAGQRRPNGLPPPPSGRYYGDGVVDALHCHRLMPTFSDARVVPCHWRRADPIVLASDTESALAGSNRHGTRCVSSAAVRRLEEKAGVNLEAGAASGVGP